MLKIRKGVAVRRAFFTSVVAAVVIAAASTAAAEIPRTPDGHPDFAGRYLPRIAFPKEKAALKGTYLQTYKDTIEATARGRAIRDDGATCATIPDSSILMSTPYGVEVVQTPTLMLWNFEGGDGVRRIYLDGRPHPKKLVPSGMGHAIGHFEGDTLVIDTVGYSGARLSPLGEMFSPKLHVVERVSFVKDGKELQIDLVADDADALEKPWALSHTLIARPELQMLQWDCEENNRNRPDENGVARTQGVLE